MKKLFEKNPMYHYTFVLAMISIACGIVIGGVNAITHPIIEANLLAAKVESYQKVLKGIDDFEEVEVTSEYPNSVQSIAKGFNANNEVLGYIYEVYGANGYGNMTVIVSVGVDGKILGAQFLTIEQTLNVPGTRTNLSYYVGSFITDLQPSSDLISGVTGSLSTLQALLSDVNTAHSLAKGEIIVDPLDEAYGEGFGVTVDNGFTPTDHIVSKSNVMQGSDVVGYMYSVTGEGVYEVGSSNSIEVDIYFNLEDEIVLIDLPLDSYNHSDYGTWRTRNLTYLENYIGLSINEIQGQVDANVGADITAGASNTRKVIDNILKDFVSEVA